MGRPCRRRSQSYAEGTLFHYSTFRSKGRDDNLGIWKRDQTFEEGKKGTEDSLVEEIGRGG